MKKLQPFGDVPKKLTLQLRRSFVATRTFSQALQEGKKLLAKILKIPPREKCVEALTKMTSCPACQGLPAIRPCSNYCSNVMKGCLAYHTELSDSWDKYIGMFSFFKNSSWELCFSTILETNVNYYLVVKFSNQILLLTLHVLIGTKYLRILSCFSILNNGICLVTSLKIEFSDNLISVGERLIGPFNIEAVVEPIDIKISDAIMNFQESGYEVTQKVLN